MRSGQGRCGRPLAAVFVTAAVALGVVACSNDDSDPDENDPVDNIETETETEIPEIETETEIPGVDAPEVEVD